MSLGSTPIQNNHGNTTERENFEYERREQELIAIQQDYFEMNQEMEEMLE